MKQVTITITCDEERLAALKLYLGQRNVKLEDELDKAVNTLYTKNVPAGVREYIGLRSGSELADTQRQRKPKSSPSSAVGGSAGEV